MLDDNAVRRLQRLAREPELPDRYHILRELGWGGLGGVFLATDTLLNRQVAVKVLHPGAANPEQLLQEARTLAALEHPGIVPVHDAGPLPTGGFFYVMRYVEGPRLDAWMQTPSTLPHRLRALVRICDAIAFAHSRGVIHRDLTPRNIIAGAFGELLILDWGLPGAGTPGWMAPEQAQGIESPAIDIFALGRLLQALTGPAAPPALQSIAAKATAPDPSGRYESATALAAELLRYLDHQRVAAHTESALERARRFLRRNRTAVYLVAAYLAMRAAIIFFQSR